jgi:hypothetical protein
LIAFAERQNGFPKLPIVTPDPPAPPARTQSQKYGGLLRLGIVGLGVLFALVTWFAYAVWQLRDVGVDIYVLHNRERPERARVQAAFRLSRDSRVTDAVLMPMCLERDLPDLARYLLAEAVSTDALARDPRGYSLTVARSPDWPEWLRLLLARRLAYGAGRGFAIPSVALEELAQQPDPMVGLWVDYAVAMGSDSSATGTTKLKAAAAGADDRAKLAAMLVAALDGSPAERESRLDEATVWMRKHHPQGAKVWKGCDVRDGQLIDVETN